MPFTLQRAGLITEAIQHGRFWSGVLERANFLGDRAVILAEARIKAALLAFDYEKQN